MISTVIHGVSRLPLSILYSLAGIVYFLIYHVFRVRRELVQQNLRNAFPEKSKNQISALCKQCYRNYCDVLVEMLKSLHIDEKDLLARVKFSSEEALHHDLESGKPVLLTLAHHCNLEWMLLAICLRIEFPLEAIYRPLSSSVMEDIMTQAYTRFGGRLIDDRSVIKSIMQRRNIPRIVSIVSDQAPNVKDDTYWTMFLNQETGFFLAPDTISRFTNYPVYFATMHRDSRGRYEVGFKKIGEPPYQGGQAVITAYVNEVEQQILKQPADWLWMHRRWKRKKSVYA